MTRRANIACLGAGRMGRGIAVVFAYAGHEVTMVDFKARAAEHFARLEADALDEVRKTLASLAQLGLLTEADVDPLIARVSVAPESHSGAALSDAGIVFEGVPEVLDLKREALAAASKLRGPDAIIASTTSTILVDDLSGAVEHPAASSTRTGSIRPFWSRWSKFRPAHTDPAITARVKALLESIGKVPVVCAATPGYIVPRIQALAMNEAARMVEEGVASAGGHRQGDQIRLRLSLCGARNAGIHRLGRRRILYYASRYLEGALGSDRYRAPDVDFTQYGRRPHRLRTGAGFLDYDGIDVDAYREQRLKRSSICSGILGWHGRRCWMVGGTRRERCRIRGGSRTAEQIRVGVTLRSSIRTSSPEHVLHHAVPHHHDAVELDRGAHHRQVEMARGVAAGEFVRAGREQEIPRDRAHSVPLVSRWSYIVSAS